MKKRKLILLILVVAAAALVALYFAVVRPIVNKGKQMPAEPVALLEGEAYFQMNGNYSDQIPVMFPQVDRQDLYEIRILSEGENYGFTHVSSGGMDYFLMWTEGTEDGDGDGILDRTLYYPELARITENFDYTTLYDETSKIPALITGSGCVVFKDRVYIRADADPAPTDEEYQTVLRRYGLADDDDPVGYEITKLVRDDRGNLMYHDGENLYCTDGAKYYDAFALKAANYDYAATPEADLSGKTISLLFDTVKVFVGDLLPDETGYYLRLVGRDVVYTTGTTTVGKIVYQNLAYYIHPRLAQASENQNQSYALFTPSFRVYNGTGAKNGGIAETDTVLFSSSAATHNGTTPDLTGALALGSGSVPADLVEALVSSGKSVGETIPLLIGTTVEPHRTLAPNKKTEYKIYAVAAVIRGGEYLDGEGGATVVAAGDKAICAYTADGMQGVGMIDLSTAPASLADAIVGLSVGGGTGEPLSSATVDYSGAAVFEAAVYQVESIQAYARNADFTSGMVVWDSTAKTTTQTATIPKSGARGYVAITYSVKVDGVLTVERTILSLEGGNATFAEDEMARAIRATIDSTTRKLILGYRQIPTTVQLPADPFTSYLVYRDFKIEGIWGTDETIGIRYANETERDIFHGGSAYEITSPASRTI